MAVVHKRFDPIVHVIVLYFVKSATTEMSLSDGISTQLWLITHIMSCGINKYV